MGHKTIGRSGATGRRRIAFLTCHLPYPPISGGRLRDLQLLRRLSDDFSISLFVVSKTYDEDRDNVDAMHEWCHSVDVFPAQAAAPTRMPAQVARHCCPPLGAAVERVTRAGEVDLVHVEGFYLMQHVPDPCPVPVLLVEQNVEFVLWRQRAEHARDASERARHVSEYLRTLRAEIDAWQQADICAALTDEDREAMMQAVPGLEVRLAPDGADHLAPRSLDAVGASRRYIAFVANFGYQPNVDGARWLCEEVMPAVRRRVDGVRLVLVGNAPPPEVRALAGDDVIVTGRVPDVAPILAAADLVVCPLRVGGGVKVKVLEAMALGKAIVTTSIGAQGLGADAQRCLVVADRPGRFAHAVTELLGDGERRQALGTAAAMFARSLPTWQDAADRVRDCYGLLLERPRVATPARRSERSAALVARSSGAVAYQEAWRSADAPAT